jgi:hypothetical protein
MNRTPHIVGATKAAIAKRHAAEAQTLAVRDRRDQEAAMAIAHPGLDAFMGHAAVAVREEIESALEFYALRSDSTRGTKSVRSFTCAKVKDRAARAILWIALEDGERIVRGGWDPSRAPRTIDREYIAAKRAAARAKVPAKVASTPQDATPADKPAKTAPFNAELEGKLALLRREAPQPRNKRAARAS